MVAWSNGFSSHMKIGKVELILIRRWAEARQVGLGIAYGPRVRWSFFGTSGKQKFTFVGW